MLLFGCDGTTSSDTDHTDESNNNEDSIVFYFDSNGGSFVDPLINPQRTDLRDLPISVRDGYILEGWYLDDDLTNEFDLDSIYTLKTMTLYAKWENIEDNQDVIKVNFILNSGTSYYNYLPMYRDDPLVVTLIPKREGYTFRGWFYDESLREHYDIYRDFIEDTILYAGWVVGDYTLIYNEQDFKDIADNLSGNYLLMADIFLPGPVSQGVLDEYSVIGDETHPFSGIFDGNHFYVDLRFVEMKYSGRNIGLFGVVTGTIRNLNLGYINTFEPYILTMTTSFNFGGLVGKLMGSIENSKLSVEQHFNLNGIDGEVNIGNIAGIIDGGNLLNVEVYTNGSYFEISIDNSDMLSGDQTINIGVICGRTINSNFENVLADGAYRIKDDYTTNAGINIDYAFGGAIGRAENSALSWIVNEENWYGHQPNIYNYATDGVYYVGGLIAYAKNCEIELVYSLQYAKLEFDVAGVIYAGGLIGYVIDSNINKAYSSGAGMGGYKDYMDNSFSHVGGFIGYASNSIINNVYSDRGANILDIGNGQVHLAGLIATMDHTTISLGFAASNISVYCLLNTNMITIARLVASSNQSNMSNLFYSEGTTLILNFGYVSDTGYGSAVSYNIIRIYLDSLLAEFEGNDWYEKIFES